MVLDLPGMLLPWFLVDFCAKFHLKTELGPWPLANACVFLLRAYWAVWDTFPTLQFLIHCRCRRDLAFPSLEPVPASPRAHRALHPHQASSCPSTAQPCLTTAGKAGGCFLPSEKYFMELEKVYYSFSEGGFGSGKFSFLKSKSHIHPPQEIPTVGM